LAPPDGQGGDLKTLQPLLERNRSWSERIRAEKPDFFLELSRQQAPRYLWIGCSDSRVPANQIVDLLPGEIFVHRNVANVVVHSDLNCLSVIQYAVEVLKVEHIIVCGHYGCGGVQAVLSNSSFGLIDNWLRHVQDVRRKHARILDRLEGEEARLNALCEINVIEQLVSVAQTTIVQSAWERGQDLTLHGWAYGIQDGLAHDLEIDVASNEELAGGYRRAIDKYEF
jgi:carbonic anhydrase